MIDRICSPIQSHLDDVERILDTTVESSIPLATEVARYTTGNRGKRIRPALLLLAARLSGATGGELPSVAAAMELIHTASLLHDDVVDDAQLRRGMQAVRAKWGNQISVLVGDFLWCCATSLLLECAPGRVMNIVQRAVRDATEGELLEITRQNERALDREIYLHIIGSKTASLFAACGRGGAIMADAAHDVEHALERYAYDVGMAFQLADDVLDYDEDPKGGDISIPFLRDQALQYAEKAKSHLTSFEPSVERDALIALAEYAANRLS